MRVTLAEVLAALLIAATAHAQAVPDNLPGRYNTSTERQEAQSCAEVNKSCTGWCDKNNPTSTTCKQECSWRVDYCKRTGLYPQTQLKSVWVGNRE